MKRFIKSQFGQKLLAFVGYFYIYLVYKTSKFSYINKEIFHNALQQERPLIVCFWHQRLFMLPLTWQWKYKEFYMLLSPHSDGTLISRILTYFKINSIFGSTFQNGNHAAIQIIKHLRKGDAIGITPDGPRGPNRKASIGIAQLGMLSKAYIMPIAYSIKKHKRLNSWDSFMVPLPFSNGTFYCGELIDCNEFNDKEILRLTVENALNHTTNLADQHLNAH